MRLFIAVDLPEPWKDALDQAARRLAAGSRQGTFTRRENFHLTLAFLGETDRRRAAERAMDRAAGAPFSLATAPPGRFPGRRGELWWMGVEARPALLALRRRLVRALREEGVWLDDAKPFRPHITLGRDLRPLPGAELAAWAASCPAEPWQVRAMTLMESRREADGLRYIPLYRAPLMRGKEKP